MVPLGMGAHTSDIEGGSNSNWPQRLEATRKIDPETLDSLYFDEDNWTKNINYYLENWTSPYEGLGTNGAYSRIEYTERGEFHSKSVDNKSSVIPTAHSVEHEVFAKSQYGGNGVSVQNKKVPGNVYSQVMDEALTCVSNSSANEDTTRSFLKVIHYYKPSWITCGFYGMDEPKTGSKNSFVSNFKIGNLANTGIAEFMKVVPQIPDFKLSSFGFSLGSDSSDRLIEACRAYDSALFCNISRQDRSFLPGEKQKVEEFLNTKLTNKTLNNSDVTSNYSYRYNNFERIPTFSNEFEQELRETKRSKGKPIDSIKRSSFTGEFGINNLLPESSINTRTVGNKIFENRFTNSEGRPEAESQESRSRVNYRERIVTSGKKFEQVPAGMLTTGLSFDQKNAQIFKISRTKAQPKKSDIGYETNPEMIIENSSILARNASSATTSTNQRSIDEKNSVDLVMKAVEIPGKNEVFGNNEFGNDLKLQTYQNFKRQETSKLLDRQGYGSSKVNNLDLTPDVILARAVENSVINDTKMRSFVSSSLPTGSESMFRAKNTLLVKRHAKMTGLIKKSSVEPPITFVKQEAISQEVEVKEKLGLNKQYLLQSGKFPRRNSENTSGGIAYSAGGNYDNAKLSSRKPASKLSSETQDSSIQETKVQRRNVVHFEALSGGKFAGGGFPEEHLMRYSRSYHGGIDSIKEIKSMSLKIQSTGNDQGRVVKFKSATYGMAAYSDDYSLDSDIDPNGVFIWPMRYKKYGSAYESKAGIEEFRSGKRAEARRATSQPYNKEKLMEMFNIPREGKENSHRKVFYIKNRDFLIKSPQGKNNTDKDVDSSEQSKKNFHIYLERGKSGSGRVNFEEQIRKDTDKGYYKPGGRPLIGESQVDGLDYENKGIQTQQTPQRGMRLGTDKRSFLRKYNEGSSASFEKSVKNYPASQTELQKSYSTRYLINRMPEYRILPFSKLNKTPPRNIENNIPELYEGIHPASVTTTDFGYGGMSEQREPISSSSFDYPNLLGRGVQVSTGGDDDLLQDGVVGSSSSLSTGIVSEGTTRSKNLRQGLAYDPCNPDRTLVARSVHTQRFAYSNMTKSSKSSYTNKWLSLCTPQVLPLTTNYIPPDLDNFYTKYSYNINIPLDEKLEEFSDRAFTKMDLFKSSTDIYTNDFTDRSLFRKLYNFPNLDSVGYTTKHEYNTNSGVVSRSDLRSKGNLFKRKIKQNTGFLNPSALSKEMQNVATAKKIEQLLYDLVILRLSQGFQLVEMNRNLPSGDRTLLSRNTQAAATTSTSIAATATTVGGGTGSVNNIGLLQSSFNVGTQHVPTSTNKADASLSKHLLLPDSNGGGLTLLNQTANAIPGTFRGLISGESTCKRGKTQFKTAELGSSMGEKLLDQKLSDKYTENLSLVPELLETGMDPLIPQETQMVGKDIVRENDVCVHENSRKDQHEPISGKSTQMTVTNELKVAIKSVYHPTSLETNSEANPATNPANSLGQKTENSQISSQKAKALSNFLTNNNPNTSLLTQSGAQYNSGTGSLEMGIQNAFLPTYPLNTSQSSICLSNGRQIQFISYSENTVTGASQLPELTISRYQWINPFENEKVDYSYRIWHCNSKDGYVNATASFDSNSMKDFNWSEIDHAVVGGHSQDLKNCKLTKSRYLLIPMDTYPPDLLEDAQFCAYLNDEELRIANFEKFLEQLFKSFKPTVKQNLLAKIGLIQNASDKLAMTDKLKDKDSNFGTPMSTSTSASASTSLSPQISSQQPPLVSSKNHKYNISRFRHFLAKKSELPNIERDNSFNLLPDQVTNQSNIDSPSRTEVKKTFDSPFSLGKYRKSSNERGVLTGSTNKSVFKNHSSEFIVDADYTSNREPSLLSSNNNAIHRIINSDIDFGTSSNANINTDNSTSSDINLNTIENTCQ
ncbi:hypothetical protein AX774_g1531, partial [Zancudomyces culisetae]